MNIKLRSLLMAFVALNLVGCGLKGPLYMPEDKSASQPPAAVEQPVQQANSAQ
jgi:predicted small lipoprotein YifL